MKRYIAYIQLVLCCIGSGLLVTSCKKTSLMTFDGGRNVFFDLRGFSPNEDSVRVSFRFTFDSVKDSIVGFPIALMGKQLDEPAGYEIEVDKDASTAIAGVHYEILEEPLIFHAHKSVDTLRIKFFNLPAMHDSAFFLNLKIKPASNLLNTQFQASKSKTQSVNAVIQMDNILLPPPGWVTTPEVPRGADYYFGTFSRKKFLTACAVINLSYLPPSVFYTDGVRYASYYSATFNDYLKSQQEAGTPVYEDDGSLMVSGPFYN